MSNQKHEAWSDASLVIGRFTAGFSLESLQAAHYAIAGRALIDTVSCAYAGFYDKAAVIARNYLDERRAQLESTLWGPKGSLPIEDAAFYNGIAGHVLDFDDVSSPMRGHPSIVILPALLALAEAFDRSGAQLAAAYAVGFEVTVRLSRPMVGDHYAVGWHATSTVGLLGATAACSHLLGLSPEQVANALGLAVAQTSGTRANFGTMAKSFQAGHAAGCAVKAVMLARAGFDSSPKALNGQYGFMSLYANEESLLESLDQIGADDLELCTSGIEIKKYPLCYATHRTIDGILDLREAHRLTLGDISQVAITSNFRGTVPLIYSAPQTALEAKFSMQYAVAAALSDGYVKLGSFTDAGVLRPEIQRFFPCISVQESSVQDHQRWNRIVLHTKDGRCLEKEVRVLRGSAVCPLTDKELLDKAKDCFAYVGLDSPIAFFDSALHLNATTVRTLIKSLPGISS